MPMEDSRPICRFRELIPVMLMISTALAACGFGETGEQTQQRWPGLVSDLGVQWAADSGIDLTNGVAVPVRAYLESFQLAQETGNLANAYPGFIQAVPPNESEGPEPSTWDRRPGLDRPTQVALIGNLRFHITSVQVTGRDTAVTVCLYNYGVAEDQGNGSYVSVVAENAAPDRGMYAVRVTLARKADEPASELPPQEGPAPAPDTNVFGNWQVTGRLTSSSSSAKIHWPTYEDDKASCIERAPDPPDRRAFLLSGEHPRSDFPTSPPSPGWPSGRE